MLSKAVTREQEFLAALSRAYRDCGWPKTAHDHLDSYISAMEVLARAVEAARALGVYEPAPPERTQWHGFAGSVAHEFSCAMRAANPGSTFGLSNDGPVARYLAAIIPHVTGETPTPVAVARELQRLEKESARLFAEMNLEEDERG